MTIKNSLQLDKIIKYAIDNPNIYLDKSRISEITNLSSEDASYLFNKLKECEFTKFFENYGLSFDVDESKLFLNKQGGFSAKFKNGSDKKNQELSDKNLNREKLTWDIRKNKFWFITSIFTSIYFIVDVILRVLFESDIIAFFFRLLSR